MLHDDEIITDADQVHRLICDQFPQWAPLPVTAIASPGTDHRLFRLGDDLLVRMPRIGWALGQVDTDRRWLPVLAPHLPVPIPVPVGIGGPGRGFPGSWSVVPWLPGTSPDTAAPDAVDLPAVAEALAAFVVALRGVDPTGGPLKTGADRGVPLAARDELTRAAIDELGDRVDRRAVTRAWDAALQATPWAGPGAWLHGDLLPGNLLVHRGRLSAVIDFGGLGLGDPAADLQPAWAVFDATSRAIFRELTGADADAWQRGRGWSLSTALVAMPYYWDRSPAIAARARRTVAAVLSED